MKKVRRHIEKVGALTVVIMLVGMCATLPAFAVEKSQEVTGEIGYTAGGGITDPGTQVEYDIEFSTTDVKWYVTEFSSMDVWNTTTENNAESPYTIKSKSKKIADDTPVYIPLEVTLNKFEGTNSAAGDIADKLELYLTGDLAGVTKDGTDIGDQDLSAGFENTDTNKAYANLLMPGDAKAWKFGFAGSYNGALPTTTLTPEYTMSFDIAIAK